MKKLIAVLMTLCLLCAAAAALAEANTEETIFSNGVKFGMTEDEIIAIEGAPHERDIEHTRGPVTFSELEYENVKDSRFDGIVDKTYLFIDGKLVAIRFDYETRDVAYDAVKESLSQFGEFAALDTAVIGNGIYAVDDDGKPEKNVVALANDNTLIVLELDDDGDDIDVTLVDLSAAYIK